ncbi:hypothetical protein [Pseudonocardia sp. NPDC049154]|uniref:hypothetical protein n=1 Tax=Pseudonocardia sp. NPDC049154 TaxID=3155501 RepID=UPI00340B3259
MSVYPVPEEGLDSRFTAGLLGDVARVLESHGYPKVTDGSDWVRLQQALYRFLYQEES